MSGSDRGSGKCPNCGTISIYQYESGNPDIREFDCNNENCRCQVFRAVDTDTDRQERDSQ